MKTISYKQLELILAHNGQGMYDGANLRFDLIDKNTKKVNPQAVWIQDIVNLEKVSAFFQPELQLVNIRPNLAGTRWAGYLVAAEEQSDE